MSSAQVEESARAAVLFHRCTNCPPKPVFGSWTLGDGSLQLGDGGSEMGVGGQIVALTNTANGCLVVAQFPNMSYGSNVTYEAVLQRSTNLFDWSDYQCAALSPGAATNITFVDTNEVFPDGGSSRGAFYRVCVDAVLNVTNFGAIGDAGCVSATLISNSCLVTLNTTNRSYGSNSVIEIFGGGPNLSWSAQTVVTQQDLICMVTNVMDGTNLWMSLPAGKTGTFAATIGSQNAGAFQAAINAASSIEASGFIRRVNIIVPAGRYLMTSSNILNPGYVMGGISDTHAVLQISSGGIRFFGQNGQNGTNGAVLLGVGAGMEHLVDSDLSWISPDYAPYCPMRDTLVELQAPVANAAMPLEFDNITFDGGVLQGAQSYNYYIINQANGAGWDTTHHAFADNSGLYNTPDYLQMNQRVVWTNCTFQHWRGEMCICWTGAATNCWREWDHCTFTDGNATADNMYYGQRIRNCTFNNVGKVLESYQDNAMNDMGDGSAMSSVMEGCVITNISELAGPGNVHVDCAITGATTNGTMPGWVFRNNHFYDNVGMEFFSLNAAENVSFVSNTFSGDGPGINLTGIGQQPSDGTQAWYMTNIVLVGNAFSCPSPLGIGFSEVEDLWCSNNTGFSVSASIGYATNIILSGNGGYNMGNDNYDVMSGPIVPGNSSQISTGQYMQDLTNNQWTVSTPYSVDGGSVFPTNLISYGNGRIHKLQASGSTFYLDDTQPGLIPSNAVLEVYAQTWDGRNCTNFYESVSATNAMSITNGSTVFFRWSGTNWVLATD